jgi:pimeloyl-ACP methyl ester carboxylesterase
MIEPSRVRSGDKMVADVRGHSIAYQHAGKGSPLVLLHGFLCDSRAWRRQLADLSDEFTVVAWDAPGAGRSFDPPDPFTITDWAYSLAAFLNVIGVERGILLGLSWGGVLAQEFYRLFPARVVGLVLADTYAGWKGSLGDSVAQARLARCVRESSLATDDFVARWVPQEFFTAASRELEDEMSAVVSTFHPAGFRLMAKALADTDTTKLLPSIAVPTLLLWGDGDQRSPLSVADQFRLGIPNARLEVIPNAGHVSNMEQPERFNAEVRNFCQASRGH